MHRRRRRKLHRERNYSVGEKVRLLERLRHLTDTDVLGMTMPLTLAQEIVAVEAGFSGWAALMAGGTSLHWPSHAENGEPTLASAVPILFVHELPRARRSRNVADPRDHRGGQREGLFHEFEARNVTFAQRLVRQAWGGLDFHVRDLDGNVVSFVQYKWTATHTEEGV